MRAQGLSPSIDSGAALPDLAAAGDWPVVRGGSRILAGLYPVCLAVAEGWAMAGAVSLGHAGALPGVAALTLIALNASGGLYRVRRSPSLLADAVPVAVRTLLVGAAVALALSDAAMWPWTVAACGTVQFAARAFANAAVRTYRCRRTRARAALVVGTGPTAEHMLDILRERGEFGLATVGQVAAGRERGRPGAAPVLGETSDLPALVGEHGIGTLVVVAEDIHPDHLDAVLRLSFQLPCETLLVQAPSDVVPVAAVRREYLAGLPCARVGWRLRDPAARLAKRVLDVVGALLLLVLALPVLAACAVAVRAEGGPGVLFRQRRIGCGGEEFVLLKFRTLKPADERESDTRWTVKNDHRMGRVGRVLRDTSLDELPQLWNVVRGDMSLVGPRPERPHFVEQFSRTCPGYMLRHRVPVGMTGWAQIHGFRGDTSIELRARLDNHYIDHWSFTGDLKILLLTARAMLCRDAG
ncbi:exopolysaccharide biosynthesis polyprenyl glycosylphosphotransferase [Actinomadura darangshiensis]|uniref:Exopolysaccharide biosynthesis polyprenyl glycosylphosphotransferase n=1 Tax=Actinomadura darangshiensis TaxID=705336 RepID=A0A4V2YV03_9ACTN|nr:exopolysaccharide biosynthesis polyprenyl glycosylphosphotransferase [Actinomadura darangshiensis]TDD79647.1 exopolysaccharide biosynthesis polyprenyl glycosylphosphotransferase [Actinomadura darangshiensis]